MGEAPWDPDRYPAEIREEIARYDELQEHVVAAASDTAARRILELGTGSGETARRLLAHHPDARLVGIDSSAEMLGAARDVLPGDRVELHLGRLEDELPPGPFDLVVSALAVHHLTGEAKASLFRRVASILEPGGRFVLGDVVVPERRDDAVIPLEEGYDLPDTVEAQLAWLAAAGLDPSVRWTVEDLAVLCGDRLR